MKISKSSIRYGLILLLLLLPDYFSNSSFRLFENVALVLMVVHIYNKHYKISRYTIIMIVYLVYLISITYIQGNGNIHLIISNLKVVLLIMLMESEIQYDVYKGIHVLFGVVALYSLINYFSLFLFPNGVYQVKTVWNEWYTDSNAYWIFGYKNSHASWYILLELISAIQYYISQNKKNKIILYVVVFVSITSQIALHSSTGLVATILGAIGIMCLTSRKIEKLKLYVNANIVTIIYFILAILIMADAATFLGPIIKNLFSKDLTFNNRTHAWAVALVNIINKPFFGWGILSSSQTKAVLGSLTYNHAHNQWLQILWQGGVVLAGIFATFILTITKGINKIRNQCLKGCIVFFYISILIEFMFEVLLDSQISWMILLLIFVFSNHKEKSDDFSSQGLRG